MYKQIFCSVLRDFLLTGFINVILREIQDNLPLLLDSALRMLLQLLGQWKTALSAGSGDVQVGSKMNIEKKNLKPFPKFNIFTLLLENSLIIQLSRSSVKHHMHEI